MTIHYWHGYKAVVIWIYTTGIVTMQ